MVTTYTLDLAAGLTQVLADGEFTYLYGHGRIAQYDGAAFEYFLADGLGSVRQLVDGSGAVTLARSYEPYGEVLRTAGGGATSYGFTGEWTDSGCQFAASCTTLSHPIQCYAGGVMNFAPPMKESNGRCKPLFIASFLTA